MLHLFRWVFIFCFHYPKLTKLSYELVKMKKKKKKKLCFWVMKTELWWHFCNFTQLMGSTFFVLSNPCPLDLPAFSSLVIPNFFFLWCFVLFIISSSYLFFFFFWRCWWCEWPNLLWWIGLMFCDLHVDGFFQLGAGFDILFPLHQVNSWVSQKLRFLSF